MSIFTGLLLSSIADKMSINSCTVIIYLPILH
jgi:hypothetical protein